MNKNKIAIIIPCYNEELRLNYQYFKNLLSIKQINWIFVDDGSTDNTLKVLNKICGKNGNIIKIEKNSGKAAAIQIGFKKAIESQKLFKWIGFMDSDGAFDLKDVKKLTEFALSPRSKNYDALYSSRVKLAGRNINRSPTRHFIGRAVATILSTVWVNSPYDTQSGFKLYRNSIYLSSTIGEKFRTKWFFDIEISLWFIKTSNRPMNIWEEPLLFWNDIPGSKLNIKQFRKIIHELFIIYCHIFSMRNKLNKFKSN